MRELPDGASSPVQVLRSRRESVLEDAVSLERLTTQMRQDMAQRETAVANCRKEAAVLQDAIDKLEAGGEYAVTSQEARDYEVIARGFRS